MNKEEKMLQLRRLKLLRLLQSRLVQKVGNEITLMQAANVAVKIFSGKGSDIRDFMVPVAINGIIPIIVKSISRSETLSPVGHAVRGSYPGIHLAIDKIKSQLNFI